MPMRRALILLAALLAGCGGSDGSGPGITFVRAIHAIPDAPDISADLNAYVVASSLPYARSSGFAIESFEGSTARRRATVTPVLPELEVGDPILEQDVTLRRDTEATFVLFGSLEAVELLQVETPRRLRPLDRLYLQFAHVATSVDRLDVYATAPDTDLASTSPLFTVSPRNYTESLEIPQGDLRLRLTPAGTLDVIFDSGTIDFPENEDGVFADEFLMTVVDTLTQGGSPVKLLAGTSLGTSLTFADENGVSGLRVVHASQDTQAFDVVVGDDFANPLATDVAYTNQTTMATVPKGVVNLNFTEPGSSTEFVFEEQVDLVADAEYTLWLVGNPEELAGLAVPADRRSIATEAKIRLVHAAPDGDFFSLYIGETAQSPPDDEDRRVTDIRFGSASVYRSLLPGNYQLTLTERFYTAGTDPDDVEETVIFGPTELSLEGGEVITFVILPPDTPGGPEILQVYDDLAP